jgi:hypothetical protein
MPALRELLHGGFSAGLVTQDGAYAILPSGYRPHPWLACRAACGPHDPPNNFRVLADHIIIIRPDGERATLRRSAKQKCGDFKRTDWSMARRRACFEPRPRLPKMYTSFNSGKEFHGNTSKQGRKMTGPLDSRLGPD